MIAAWALIKPFAPYIAIVLAFAMAWQCGSAKTADRMRGEVAEAEADARLARAERDVLEAALESFRSDVLESNARVIAKADAFDVWVETFEAIADKQRIAIAASYAVRVEEARAETSELRARIAEMAPGEACLEALEEVTHALSQ